MRTTKLVIVGATGADKWRYMLLLHSELAVVSGTQVANHKQNTFLVDSLSMIEDTGVTAIKAKHPPKSGGKRRRRHRGEGWSNRV